MTAVASRRHGDEGVCCRACVWDVRRRLIFGLRRHPPREIRVPLLNDANVIGARMEGCYIDPYGEAVNQKIAGAAWVVDENTQLPMARELKGDAPLAAASARRRVHHERDTSSPRQWKIPPNMEGRRSIELDAIGSSRCEHWLRTMHDHLIVGFALAIAACGTSNTNPADASTQDDTSVTDSAASDVVVPVDSGATTTIAQARTQNVTSSITVLAVVTALHGTPGDYSQWYIEDPAGGPSSGVAVYCDPDLASCPTIRAPAVNDLVLITGALSTYKGELQFVPTAQTLVQSSYTPPPIATVPATELIATANSAYRGVLVKLASKLTVDNATPASLYDTNCGGSSDAGADAGLTLCSGCEPPTYSGFEVNDGAGHEIYVEDFFFYTDHLQSSPGSARAVPVRFQ